jgi:hypothetical protein
MKGRLVATSHEHPEKTAGAKRERARNGSNAETVQLVFTFHAATGAVAKIEKIDAAGKRREIEKDETLKLVGKDNLHEIEAALDEAFEAGISSVFEPEDDEEESAESEEETELRRVLLAGIVGRGVRRRLQRRLIQRLILSQTLRH